MTEDVSLRRVEVADADTDEVIGDIDHYVRLCNAVCSADTGHDDLSTMTRDEALGMFRDRADRLHELFLAERDGVVVAAATTMMLVRDAEALETDIMIDPARPWDGVAADALLDAVSAVADAHGLDTVQTWSLHRPVPPVRPLSPSTGVGVIDGAAPMADYLVSRGFTLEQVERNSRFDLQGSFDLVEATLADAVAAAGPEYRVEGFTDVCPEELIDSFAAVVTRMSTDAPQGGTVVEEDIVDAARIRRREARMQDQRLTTSVVVAVHTPTDEVVAYNELVIGADRTEPTHQYGTLVLREHRGHRLGAVVKAAGLLRLREVAPESPCVATFNAEENAHMLAINVAIGFVPASYAGAWKRVSGG